MRHMDSMRKLALFFAAVPALIAAPSLVQCNGGNQNFSNANPHNATITGVTAGNTLILMSVDDAAVNSISAVTISAGSGSAPALVKADSGNRGGFSTAAEMWKTTGVSSGTVTFSITWTSAAFRPWDAICEISGAPNTDQKTAGSGSNPSITTTASSIVLGVFVGGSNATAGTGFTKTAGGNFDQNDGYMVPTTPPLATGTYTPFSSGANNNSVVANFIAAASSTCNLSLLGVCPE